MNKKQKQHQSIVPGNATAVNVVNQDLGFALRTWKRKVKDAGVLEYVKDNVLLLNQVLNVENDIKAKYIVKNARLTKQILINLRKFLSPNKKLGLFYCFFKHALYLL
jgi:hypothetical protein